MYYKNNCFSQKNKIPVYIKNIYVWTTCGLLITLITSWFISKAPFFIKYIFFKKKILFFLIINQIIISYIISNFINKLNILCIINLFIIYMLFNGLIYSSIFIVYHYKLIIMALFFLIMNFITMNIISFYYKKDLNNINNSSLMFLTNIILSNIFNPWINNIYVYKIMLYVNIILFSIILTCETQQNINIGKNMIYKQYNEQFIKYTILGSFIIYINLYNIFLLTLKILKI